jgi:hypothetical protein
VFTCTCTIFSVLVPGVGQRPRSNLNPEP